MTPVDLPDPFVSVVIATYRSDDYLRQAIASVLAQDCDNFEILVSDDGNEARTRETTQSFGDPRLVYHGAPVRLGPARNHWGAILRARGNLIAILNHDDLWKPAFLSRMQAGLQDSRVVVAFSDHDVIDAGGDVLEEESARLSSQTGRDTLAEGVHAPFARLAVTCAIPAAQSAVFRKSALDLDALPSEAGPAYDFWLNYLLARKGGGAFYTRERLASWRRHPASVSFVPTQADWPAGAAACWERIATDPLFSAWRAHAKTQAADFYATAALASIRGRDARRARGYALRAFARDPTNLRSASVAALAWLPAWLGHWSLSRARLSGAKTCRTLPAC